MREQDPSVFENYLADLSLLLIDLYGDTSDERDGFALGRHLAIAEVISVMQQQADAFQIPRSRINLPEEDIL